MFKPAEISKDISVFFIHGGGWRGGSRTTFHKAMEELNNRGYLTASTDYRLYAKDAFEQLADVRAAYDRFVSLLKEMNRPLKIVVYGESAGAHLASLLLCANPGECGEENHLENEWVKPLSGILQATPYDFLPHDEILPSIWGEMQSIAGASFEVDPERYERLSLKNYIRKDNPPIFFVEAELEHLFLSEFTLKIAKKHREMGIDSHWKVYRRAEHGFFYDISRPSQKAALEDICLYLDGKLETL